MALCKLFIGAFALCNIRFFIGNKTSITILHYIYQTQCLSPSNNKRGMQKMTITHHKANDKVLCPVKIWCKIVHQISKYASSNPNMTVNTYFFEDGSKLLFTGSQLLKRLHLATSTLGPDTLGFWLTRLAYIQPEVEQQWQCILQTSQYLLLCS
jgi:hypothetical protein